MLSLTSMFPGMLVRRLVIYECLDAMDASNAETSETLNGLGFNKEMQAKKTRNFLENAYSTRLHLHIPGYEDPALLPNETEFTLREVAALYELCKKLGRSIINDGLIHK
ncbi:hypothetical protein Tco_0834092, partial [Tanacetum coccineum]